MFSLRKSQTPKWTNWSETVLIHPESIYYPKTVGDVVDLAGICKAERKSIRAVGRGHSFTPLAATSELLVSLDHLSGIESVDRENNLVTIWAGTTLKTLGELLFEQGYAMENLGDINVQSIAGAISTGTHGTGADFGSISAQVTQLTIVTPSGEILEVSREKNSAYFQAMRLSLGMLGIIVKIQLRVIPVQQMVSESYRMSLVDCLAKINELRRNNRHFEFYWFPHTKTVQIKRMNSTDMPTTKKSSFQELVVENGLLWGLSELCRMQPKLTRPVSHISARGVPVSKNAGPSHEMYATKRLVKFNEMEYAVPAELMTTVLKDIRHVIAKKKIQVHFPLECRFVKKDAIWLSPAFERDVAFIAVHMYKGMYFQGYFDAVEEVFQYHGGRPHWGKMHTMTAEKLQAAYPHFDDFLSVRKKLDSDGMLLNGYVKRLFNI
ncbi:D-arabinono-1,4-lactone oxidase [Virgibacillus doumboii]|uniref:D-arabinono-1,4-lactone oxidase n=1 Tax=Virgibacillus doumboii TaxID=2697503 RepID=UPI0013E00CF2|nr:D-arabinono-1,4-lactone oxidase [Virgibacillus doumboii]